MNTEQKPNFESWCIVELFGHQQIAGKVTEQVIASQGFIRVDVPDTEDKPGFTRMFGTGAIYSIIPTTEEIATAFVRRNVGQPIHPFQLQLPKPENESIEPDDEDDSELPFRGSI